MPVVYTMVKFGGVRNYIVATWEPHDLDACRDLNLPCADVSPLAATLAKPAALRDGELAGFTSKEYLHIVWLKVVVVEALIKQGFAIFYSGEWVWPALMLKTFRHGGDGRTTSQWHESASLMSVDTDLAFTSKPVWESYLAFLEEGGADGAFMTERPLNAGNFVLLPTAGGKALMAAWALMANESIAANMVTQVRKRGVKKKKKKTLACMR